MKFEVQSQPNVVGLCSATFICLDSTDSIETIFTKISSCTPSCCILDCVDVFVDMFTVDAIVGVIFRLKAKFAVLVVCSENSINNEEYSRFCAAANSIIKLQRRDDRCVSELVTYKRNGKRTEVTETVALNSDLKISSEKFVPLEVTSAAVTVDPTKAMDLEPELSEKELAAKSQLNLPFTSLSKQSELNNLRMADRKVRVGGQIIYTPDKEDDLDDSDPDEDLNL
ncbi:hypothetical protein COOONC_05752 [Cooperia oncophora]